MQFREWLDVFVDPVWGNKVIVIPKNDLTILTRCRGEWAILNKHLVELPSRKNKLLGSKVNDFRNFVTRYCPALGAYVMRRSYAVQNLPDDLSSVDFPTRALNN